MRLQFILTPSEAKRMIAKGISSLDQIQKALKKGRIILKGGTTVSALSEELCGKPLMISGRITPLGTKTSKISSPGSDQPHALLIENGKHRYYAGFLEQPLRI